MGKFLSSLLAIILCLWFVLGTGLIHHEFCSDENKIVQEQETHYKAAVVEYKPIPIGNQSPGDALLSNGRVYVQIMQQAANENVDIIVFPEYGISTIALPPQREKAREFFVDISQFGVIPCDNATDSTILHELSCAARQFSMYTVVNLGEVEFCQSATDPKCPEDGAYQYNTNVVFDRTGAIIARYRKFHLYFEPQFDYPELEYSTFQTDFGIEFGLFTCFDIISAHPAVELVARQNIRHFAFPTAWIDELPFLTAIQAQSMWAHSNNVNLLAAGYHQPDRGSMGSGIYSGSCGAFNYVFNSSSGTKLIISSIPITPGIQCEPLDISTSDSDLIQRQQGDNHMWLREDLSNCSHKPININEKKDTLCHEDLLCCDIEYDLISTDISGHLKLLVFEGRRTVAAKRDWFEWQVCAILHCLNETLESCTENIQNSSNNPIFTSIAIKMRPLRTEYDQQGTAEPGLSLIDTNLNLIPLSYFEVRKWTDPTTNMTHAEAKTRETIELENIKTVSLIQKIYGGRL